MAPVTAKKITDFILCFAYEHGDLLTNLKLQKLLYYAQAWHLALYDAPLLDDDIEAWVHGPAVRSVYTHFKNFGWHPIQVNLDCDNLNLPEFVQEHLIEVIDEYGGLTAYELERMTHEELPWQNARRGLPIDEPSNAVIAWEDMKDYYGHRVH